ncbi:glycosyltransferase [Thauera sp. SWB20]|uniref:glycosyltransferase n=1 Tax=Thauera sp. SWB20 TaxID=1572758 RepID=UPI002F40159F
MRVFSLDKQSGAGVDLKLPFRLERLARQWKPDVVHTHLRALSYASLLTFRSYKKFHTIHSLAEKECSAKVRFFQRILFALGWVPVAISEVVRESICRAYGLKAPIVVNGVEKLEIDSPSSFDYRCLLDIPSDAAVLAHVGRLNEVKDQLRLLRVFSEIAEEDPRVFCLFVGDDPVSGAPYLAKMNQFVEGLSEDVRRRVRFLGARSDVGSILDAADVFVLCSRYEGLPLALLEAMSIGKRCVCSAVGGIPDAIDECSGWLFEAQSDDDFKRCLIEAIFQRNGEREGWLVLCLIRGFR